jgi:polyhydroxybutyrate depolymerase
MRVLTVIVITLVIASPLFLPRASASAPGDGSGSTPGSIVAGGLERTFRLYVPPSHDRTRPAPLVIALHGGGGTGAVMEQLTAGGLNRLAAREGFVVVYPDGVERHWNDGRGISDYRAHRENIDRPHALAGAARLGRADARHGGSPRALGGWRHRIPEQPPEGRNGAVGDRDGGRLGVPQSLLDSADGDLGARP